MTDTPHPRYLPNNYRPSVLDLDGEERFVASARITDGGYLSVVHWDGTRSLVPRHRVREVERVQTERTRRNNTACNGIVDDDLVRDALAAAGKVSDTSEREEVVA